MNIVVCSYLEHMSKYLQGMPVKPGVLINEPAHDKTYNKACVTSEDSVWSESSLSHMPSTAYGIFKEV